MADSQGKTNIKQQQAEAILASHTFINFRNSPLVLDDNQYIPLTSTHFARIAYEHFPYATVAQIKEVEHLVRHNSPDLSHLSHLIAFGTTVWDTRLVAPSTTAPPDSTIIRSPITPNPATRPQAHAYLLQLADGDQALANDYLQAIAPLFLERKPTGVIWFVGGGANGKSALINAIYRIIGPHLTSLTVSAIEDGRDTPRLNGVIGNVCRESSEGRVDDTERYKAIGTHEPFMVHKFHSQDATQIDTNFHTIFNANNIPIFSDKTEGARRRTLIVPFPAKFQDDPNFEARTFTPSFLGGLLALILEAAATIRDNDYRYKFSPATLGAKAEYDAEVNSAEAYLAHLRKNRVKAFTNYNLLRYAYESWCADQGYVPLGVTSLRRVMSNIAFAKNTSFRDDAGANHRWYFIDNTPTKTKLTSLDNGLHVGLDAPPTPTAFPSQTKLASDW